MSEAEKLQAAIDELKAWADTYQGQKVLMLARMLEALEASENRVRELEEAMLPVLGYAAQWNLHLKQQRGEFSPHVTAAIYRARDLLGLEAE